MRRGTFVRFGRGACAAVALTACAGSARGQTPPAATVEGPNVPVAAVNGETIALAQVDAAIRQRPALAGPLTVERVRQLRTAVASDLVDDLLLRQFLRKYAPPLDGAEVDRHLKAFAELLDKQGKTPADFFRETGQTEAQARETWATLLRLNAYVKEKVTDGQLETYYAANRDHFDRVEVRVRHVVVRVGPTAPPAEREAGRRKLSALRADIAAGKIAFADAARKHSHCPSAPQGGDLGYVARKGMLLDEAFCKAAFALKVGELSDVVEADDGFHLLTVDERKPGVPSTFEKCLDEVRESFADDFRMELVAKLRRQANVRVAVP